MNTSNSSLNKQGYSAVKCFELKCISHIVSALHFCITLYLHLENFL